MTVLSVTVTDHPTITVITLDGELDLLTVDRLRRAIDQALERGRADLVVDAARLDFCDSHGLQALVEGLHRARAAGGSLRLAYPHDHLTQLLELTRLIRLFPGDTDLEIIIARRRPRRLCFPCRDGHGAG
ncbi:STAS domain-containing protein [Planomonospora corallina]|uniref:Anti-sigma factor antagonist n=1 Tax=Planomonospora corallina TaxID=1806052 RepID=A0ABV8IHV9_9ACTN